MKIHSVIVATIILIIGIFLNSAYVNASSGTFKSNGLYHSNNNTTDASDDVIIDASDFEKLATVCQ